MYNHIIAFDPSDWYWIKNDGSIYSSYTNDFHDASYEKFKSWILSGKSPTQYPRDISGEDSHEELMNVLSVYE